MHFEPNAIGAAQAMSDGEGLLFQARGLRKTFGQEAVLNIEHLKIRRGKMTAIVGASGSGKTTLLNVLGGLDKPDDGSRIEVWLDDGMTPLDADGLQTVMAQRASYAFQQGHLLASATLRLNLGLASRGQAKESDFKKAILRAGLGRELEKDANLLARRTWGLSGGQSQRLNVARAYVRDPSIVFADEPSSNLDPANGQHVIEELKKWLKEQPGDRSVILVTHDHELASKADDLIILHKGSPVYGGDEPTRSMPARDIQSELAKYADAAEGAAFEPGPPPDRRKRSGVLASLRDAMALAWQEMFAARSDKQMRFSPRRFRQWQSLFSYALLMSLLVGLLYAQGYAQTYFEKEMAHPGVRHVIISGNPVYTEETSLSPDLLAELRERPRFANKGVFPRLGSRETLYVAQPEAEVARARYNFEYLVLDPEEDAAKAVKLVDIEGHPTPVTLAEALRAKDQESGRIAIALHRGYFLGIARKLEMSPAELERRLRLDAQSRLIPFDVVGFYDVSVPDRGYVYEGIMSIGSHVNFAIVRGPKMWLDDDGRPRRFERAAVYFDIATYKQTLSELSKTNFAFSRDNFQKLASLFDVSLEFKRLLGLLIVCVSVFALCILFFNALAQMSRVWKSALILLAHGVPAYIFAVSVSTQIAIGLGLAAALCYAVIFAVAHLIEDGPGLLVALRYGLGLLGIFAGMTVVGVLVGVYVMKPSRTALGEQLKST
jgi:putative ABC transport system ATP-binding protein